MTDGKKLMSKYTKAEEKDSCASCMQFFTKDAKVSRFRPVGGFLSVT